MVERLLAAGANVHAGNDGALVVACSQGYLNVVERLIAAGADVHARNGDALWCAASSGHLSVVDHLLAEGADVHAQTDKALQIASNYGYVDVVTRLLAAGADARKISWDDLASDTWPAVVRAMPHAALDTLPDDVQTVWVRVHLRRFAPRLRQLLQRTRDRLDRPPSSTLGAGMPTREQLIVHLRTAGRRFAREYWAEGLPLFLEKGAELGPVPDEFVFVSYSS